MMDDERGMFEEENAYEIKAERSRMPKKRDRKMKKEKEMVRRASSDEDE
jgi:hypothetical protein